MKLMTKAIEKAMPALYSQESVTDPLIHVKFFDPSGSWTWFASEYCPVKRIFFGLVVGHETELGYFDLDELEGMSGRFGLGIERDIYFKPVLLSSIKKKLADR